MLLVIQPLKKYLTEHESETLSTCYDKYLASCQDAQRPLSKTASLPEGKCILLLYLVLLSTVQQWGTTDKVPANNGGKISFIYPIAVTLFANPILSGTSGSISKYDSIEGASIESASLTECIIINDWNVYKKQQYRLIIIGK